MFRLFLICLCVTVSVNSACDAEESETGSDCTQDMERQACYKKCPKFIPVTEFDVDQLSGVWIDEFNHGLNYSCGQYVFEPKVYPNDTRHVDIYYYTFPELSHSTIVWQLQKRNDGYYCNVLSGYVYELVYTFIYAKNGCVIFAGCVPDERTGANNVIIKIDHRCDATCNMTEVMQVLKKNHVQYLPLQRRWNNQKCSRYFGNPECQTSDLPNL